MKLAINQNKPGAPYGLDGGRAKIPFEIVECARDLYESSIKPRMIHRIIEQKVGHEVSIHTLNDWLYFKTRVYG